MHLLLADENFDLGVVEALKNLGHDVITLYDINLGNIKYPDDQVLATATELGRCVLSFNRKDFIKLHKQGIPHAGIIICTYNRDRLLLAEKSTLL